MRSAFAYIATCLVLISASGLRVGMVSGKVGLGIAFEVFPCTCGAPCEDAPEGAAVVYDADGIPLSWDTVDNQPAVVSSFAPTYSVFTAEVVSTVGTYLDHWIPPDKPPQFLLFDDWRL